jgi:hypothetical protein
MKKMYLMGLMFIVTSTFISAQCSNYDKAKDNYDHFIGGYEQIRQLQANEQKKLAKAMCEASDDDRRSVGRSVADRVQTEVWNNFDELNRQKEEAEKNIEAVLQDQQCQEKWNEMKKDQERIKEIWPRIEKIKEKVSAGNNPVFAAMTELGKEAHTAYQNAHASEGIKEFPVAHGDIDFVTYNCEVIELKSNNSSSLYKGRKEAEDYTSDLNNDQSTFKKLVDRDSKFATCKKFKAVVMAYESCPEITDDGEMHLRSIEWKMDWHE